MSDGYVYRKNEHTDAAAAIPRRIEFEALADDQIFWSACVLQRLARGGAASDGAAKLAAQVADEVLQLRRQRFGKIK
jgi:hypothetical protein